MYKFLPFTGVVTGMIPSLYGTILDSAA